jgi:DNA polymerase-1
MGAPRLQQHCQTGYGVVLTAEQAWQYREGFFAAYPAFRRWHRQTGRHADSGPQTMRTMTGRRRLAVQRYTEMLNTPVQGSGADGLKLAMARLFAHRHEAPEARLILAVHDELVVECPIAQAEEAAVWLARHMREAMEAVVDHKVPIVVDTTIAADWAGTPLRQEEREPSV